MLSLSPVNIALKDGSRSGDSRMRSIPNKYRRRSDDDHFRSWLSIDALRCFWVVPALFSLVLSPHCIACFHIGINNSGFDVTLGVAAQMERLIRGSSLSIRLPLVRCFSIHSRLLVVISLDVPGWLLWYSRRCRLSMLPISPMNVCTNFEFDLPSGIALQMERVIRDCSIFPSTIYRKKYIDVCTHVNR